MSKPSFDPNGLTPDDLDDAVNHALGNCSEDVMEQMRQVSEALDWMSDIFDAIRDEARSGRPAAQSLSTIARRADCGKYLADDFANIADVWREEMECAIDAAGVKHGGAS